MNTPNIDQVAPWFNAYYTDATGYERMLMVKQTDGEYVDLDTLYPWQEVYVNVYLCNRAPGGQEEGGWWFDYGEPDTSIRCRADAAAEVYAEQQGRADAENDCRRSDLSSVICEGRYEVYLESRFARSFPTVKPHYE